MWKVRYKGGGYTSYFPQKSGLLVGARGLNLTKPSACTACAALLKCVLSQSPSNASCSKIILYAVFIAHIRIVQREGCTSAPSSGPIGENLKVLVLNGKSLTLQILITTHQFLYLAFRLRVKLSTSICTLCQLQKFGYKFGSLPRWP
jgi:hypothetical protein